MNITILSLSISEWQKYKTLRLEALKEEPQAFGDKYSDWIQFSNEQWQERPNDPDTIILIVEDNENAIGMIGIHFEPMENEKRAAHIWGMYVSKQYRGIGIGKLLMKKALEKLDHKPDVAKVKLMVSKTETPAVNLYTSLGFQTIGTKDWVLGDGKQHELYVMEKVL